MTAEVELKPTRWRKKPVEVEAWQWDGSHDGYLALKGRCPSLLYKTCDFGGVPFVYVVIPTLEGHMEASPGDWIVCGIKGEFYPCKPDIFAATYEPANTRPTDRDAVIEECARVADAYGENRRRVSGVAGHACESIAAAIRSLAKKAAPAIIEGKGE